MGFLTSTIGASDLFIDTLKDTLIPFQFGSQLIENERMIL